MKQILDSIPEIAIPPMNFIQNQLFSSFFSTTFTYYLVFAFIVFLPFIIHS